jgi:Lon protease-like protein
VYFQSLQQNAKWLKAYVRKAIAEIGLGRLKDAKHTCLMALKLDPSSDLVADTLEDVNKRLKAQGIGQRAIARVTSDEFDCCLCSSLLFQPVTTPCGHSYCKSCLQRALDHGIAQCPLCRTQLHLGIGANLCVNVAFDKILSMSFPQEYEERRKEEESANLRASGGQGASQTVTAPVFYLNAPALPDCPFSLHIFEPRYRLMVRRCLEGSRRFLLVSVNRDGEAQRVGTLLEIIKHELLPDGRSLVDTKGVGRLRVISTESLDGYGLATCIPYDDEPISPESTAEAVTVSEQIKAKLAALMTGANPQVARALEAGFQEAGVSLQSMTPQQTSWIPAWICRLPGPILSQLLESRSLIDRLHRLAQVFSD